MLNAKVSKASSSTFRALAPICFNIPIPLVPDIPWFEIVPSALPNAISPSVVAALPPAVIP